MVNWKPAGFAVLAFGIGVLAGCSQPQDPPMISTDQWCKEAVDNSYLWRSASTWCSDSLQGELVQIASRMRACR